MKARIQRYQKRNDLRRFLYREIMNNFTDLRGQVEMAEHDDEMRIGIGQRFAMGYKRLAYDLAQKDAAVLYSLARMSCTGLSCCIGTSRR